MEKIRACAEYFEKEDTDVIIYSGSIDRTGYEDFCDKIPDNKRKNLLLVLCTFGGDPNAGYRIARAAIHNYESNNFRILIPSYCKSAGTLICIGANELVMADQAELGPLDVQMQKKDEIFQQSSGLDILRGMTYLQAEALESFRSYLLDINGGSGLSTKIASEISSKLVIGLYEPLFAQIDPVRLGEMDAALQIAHHYGNRLNEKSSSLKVGALRKLISDYPTHGFVIDRAEARVLFNQVVKPNNTESDLATFVKNRIWLYNQQGKPAVHNFLEILQLIDNEEEEQNEQSKMPEDSANTDTPSEQYNPTEIHAESTNDNDE